MSDITLFGGVAFAALCAVLLVAPFVPAFHEWLRPTDDGALAVSPNYTSDIDHFARRLHADASARLGRGADTGHQDFELVAGLPEGDAWRKPGKRLIATHSLRSETAVRSSRPLYVEGHLKAGPQSLFTALYATSDLTLGDGSEVHDWVHAGGALRIGRRAVAMRRVSSGESIALGEESWFERLHAPTVRFGSIGDGHGEGEGEGHGAARDVGDIGESGAPVTLTGGARHDPAPVPALLADLPGSTQRTPQLAMVRGDCDLPPGRVYDGSLVVSGFLTIGAGTVVRGDVKARDGITLRPGARVEGAITSESRVYLADGAGALGPLVSESDILLGPGSTVGLAGRLTTVTARNILGETGATVHGTVWAHEVGLVRAA